MPVGSWSRSASRRSRDQGLAGPLNSGPHGFSEILYGFASAWNNNGSAFAGLTAGTNFYDGMLGVAMPIGRFAVIVPALALAGSLAAQRTRPIDQASMPTHSPIFVGLLVGVILIVGALSFFPALALGPVAEALTSRLCVMNARTEAARRPDRPRARSSTPCGSSTRARCCATRSSSSVEVVSVLVTGQLIVDLVQGGTDVTFELQIAVWLWLTVLFANFAEALAEGRGKAQADALRKTRTTTVARGSTLTARRGRAGARPARRRRRGRARRAR